MNGRAKVRISDVAARAGVAPSSVSRVLSNHPNATPEIRERVLRAAAELGYQPNRVARSLRVQRSSVIALIVPDIENPFFHRVVRAVQDVMDANKFAVFLCNTDENVDKQAISIDLVLAEQVAGIVIAPVMEIDQPAGVLGRVRTPMVVIDRRLQDVQVDTVRIDNVAAARAAVSHLIDDGHRRIGAVLGSDVATTGRERREGYEQALLDHGLTVDAGLIRVSRDSGTNREDIGYALTQELLDTSNPPTALFTGTNLLTLGALRAIHERSLSIPGDIAVAAFDDIDWMPIFRPALTSVAQPAYEVGRAAAELLLQRIADHARPVQDIVLPARLLVRQSCAMHGDGEESRVIGDKVAQSTDDPRLLAPIAESQAIG
jgi:DNA-binding LacI/PurR family transcriptional regulator